MTSPSVRRDVDGEARLSQIANNAEPPAPAPAAGGGGSGGSGTIDELRQRINILGAGQRSVGLELKYLSKLISNIKSYSEIKHARVEGRF